MRPLCPTCNARPVAINRHVGEKIYYRKVCDVCSRSGKKDKKPAPAWTRAGYIKKAVCEKCNFKFKLQSQSLVFYVDGNLRNNDWFNLKTICLNCAQEVYNSKTSWKPGPLIADY